MAYLIRPTIALSFLDRCRLTPKLPAYAVRENEAYVDITWETHHDRVREVALGLQSMGLKQGERVAILSATRYEWTLADFGAIGSRAVTVPIYPSLPVDEIRFLLEHSESVFAFVEDTQQLEKILRIRAEGGAPLLRKIITFEPEALRLAMGEPNILSLNALREIGRRETSGENWTRFTENLRAIRPDDLFTIAYTSGTTGIPKGVQLTHENLMSSIQGALYALGSHIRSDRETTLTFLPFSHIFGRVEAMAGISFGFRMAFSHGGASLARDLEDVKPSLLFAVPVIFEKAVARVRTEIEHLEPRAKKIAESLLAESMHRAQGGKPSLLGRVKRRLALETSRRTLLRPLRAPFGGNLKLAISGGAPLPAEVGEFFHAFGFTILEGYGLTETCAPITLNPPGAPRFGSVGKPLPQVDIRLGEDGEVLVKAPNVFHGYEKDAEATKECFEGPWFRTGDVGRLDSDGYLYITGRKKDLLILSTGKNVAPQKLEALAHLDSRIRECVVYGDGKPFVSAMVTLQAEEAIRFANAESILFSDFGELIRQPKIHAWVSERIEEWNSRLAPFEQIRAFFIHSQDLSVESGDLTPSLKVRRQRLHSKFRSEFEALYRSPARVRQRVSG